MVKKETAEDILAHLRGAQSKLAILAGNSLAEFSQDFTRVESAKHLLQVSIERCLDLAHHIISDAGWRSPADYYDSFVVLNEEGILPDEFMPALRQMVAFRNRVVHLYSDVEDRAVYDILQNDLGDFDRFARYVLAYLRQQS